MNTQLGKNFIVTLMAVVLALGGFTWLSERTRSKDATQVAAMNDAPQQSPAASTTASQLHQDAATYPISDTAQAARSTPQSDTTDSAKPGYDEGYRVGYQDGERDCQQAHLAARRSVRPARYYSTRHYYASRSYRRSGVAGVAYAAPRRDHSTRNMILTMAAPAALGAGIGGIAGGGKGAGIGALLGGGGGALYYLIKHRR